MSSKEEVLRKIIENENKILHVENESSIKYSEFSISDIELSDIKYETLYYNPLGSRKISDYHGIPVYYDDSYISCTANITFILKDTYSFDLYFSKDRTFTRYYLYDDFVDRIEKLFTLTEEFKNIFKKHLSSKSIFNEAKLRNIYPTNLLTMFNKLTVDDMCILSKDTVKNIILKDFPTVEGIDKESYEVFLYNLCNRCQINYDNDRNNMLLIDEKVIKEILSIPRYIFNNYFKDSFYFFEMIDTLSVNDDLQYKPNCNFHADIVIEK